MTDEKTEKKMSRFRAIKNYLLLAPPLFAASFVLSIFQDNISEVTLPKLFAPLILAVFFAVLLTSLLAAVFRDKVKTAVFGSVLIIVFFAYNELLPYSPKIKLALGSFKFDRDDLLFALCTLVLTILFVLVLRTKRYLLAPAKFLLLVSIFTLAIPLFGVSQFELVQKSKDVETSRLQLPVVDKTKLDESQFPDIYFIQADSYAAAKVIKTNFGFDNSAFIKYLEEKGFYVAQDATSNYPKTFLSLTSILNMEYMDYLAVHKNSADLTITEPLLENHNSMKFLKSLGYKYYHMGSWWGPTKNNKYADENITLSRKNLVGIDEFDYVVLESTMLRPFLSNILPRVAVGGSERDYRNIIEYQFAQLAEVSKRPGPKYVFVHLIAPHDPYVFGRDCQPIGKDERETLTTEKNYENQVLCVNKKLEVVINQILENKQRPQVILLHSDEGAPFLRERLKPRDNWKTASNEMIGTKYPVLAAYYLGGIEDSGLYQSITPVNAFRLIFNNYFGKQFPLLPDKNYIIPDVKHLYNFKDVTSIVKEELAKKRL